MKRGTDSLPRGSVHQTESVGVKDGLSERSDFMSDQRYNDASFNESSSAAPGFTRQAKGQRTSKSAKSKGLNFEIEGCSS